ncbi:MAG: helix-turn-helix domain-containing protein [Brevundimonas sp.]|uniref:helix-turn-helix domain-containing protein n=1 Tax=Brevundimonas sp. TaxID=1871086 RepID=UPI000BDB39F7|nr:MAG: helix-turn-helix domain-containing protein [Caulobacterales bacterium 32-69-10]
MSTPASPSVVPFPPLAPAPPPAKTAASQDRIWGKAVIANGYAGIPSILIQAQSRLGLTAMQFNILVQLLDYYRDPNRAPFPSRAELGRRIGVKPKTIQTNIRQLEQAGLVRREMRKTAAGDWASNIYHLDGLIERVRKLEPEFTQARKDREAARLRVSTPVGLRQP